MQTLSPAPLPPRWKWIALGMLSAFVAPVAGDFAVTSEIFVGEAQQPIQRSQTLFVKDEVFDFPEQEDAESVLIDLKGQVAVIYDPQRKMACRVPALELLRTTAALRAQAEQLLGSDRLEDGPSLPARRLLEYVAFAGDPTFEQDWDAASGVLKFTGSSSYRVQTSAPPHPECVRQYRDFADWMARLNATRPGGTPAEFRLALNRRLAELERVPEKVALERPQPLPPLRSEHSYVWAVSVRDRQRMDAMRDKIGQATTTDLVGFRVKSTTQR